MVGEANEVPVKISAEAISAEAPVFPVFQKVRSSDCLAHTDVLVDNNPHYCDIASVHGFDGPTYPSFLQDPFCRRDFKPEVLRKALPRLAVALGFWAVGLYCNNLSQAWLQANMGATKSHPGYYESRWAPIANSTGPVILWDAGFVLFKPLHDTWLADLVGGSIPVFALIRFGLVPGPLSMRWTFLCRTFLLWGVLWALRGLTIISTALPTPLLTCEPRITYPDNIFLEALAIMPPFSFWYWEVTCHDVLFSGHTMGIVLATLLLMRYLAWAPWHAHMTSKNMLSVAFLVDSFLVINLLVSMYCIIATRFHYTCDVLVAAMITVMLFQGYHAAVRVAFLPRNEAYPVFAFSLYPFLQWFDDGAVDVAVMKLNMIRNPVSPV